MVIKFTFQGWPLDIGISLLQRHANRKKRFENASLNIHICTRIDTDVGTLQ